MGIMQMELREYLTSDGKCPFGYWLRSLKNTETRARIRIRLNRLLLGNFGDCRPVGSGVSEIRIDFGPGYRVYFGRDGDTRTILLCAGTKKTQPKDIEKAITYWQDYKRRKNE